MSQRINHRREGKRHQDNGPTYESRNPMAGCNSTHVARARRSWKKLGRRAERRAGSRGGCAFWTGSRRVGETLTLDEEIAVEGLEL